MDRYFQKEKIMALSLNTNRGAMAALQTLNSTNKGLDQVQKRVSTGLSVASTKDDSATFITAQNLRGRQGDLKAVTNSLGNAKSIVDVAVSGAEQISDAVNQMKTLAKQAADATITDTQRASMDKAFSGLRDQINTVISSSEFNGTNLLNTDTTATGKVQALKSLADGDSTTAGYQADTLVVANQGMSLPTAAAAGKLTNASSLADASKATDANLGLDDYQTKVNSALSDLGVASQKIDKQMEFTSKLADTIESGIGNLVDADMAKESAKLTALQTKQQLGIQALSIANQGPQSIGQLFRG
jgi:flagellin